jgi:(p)ppGpp synthase/HD superfamily hydrolase
VTAIVLELGGGEDEAIGAMLHDAVEDGGGPDMQERIGRDFGAAVAATVAQNSDTDADPKPPWLERKRAYLAHMPEKAEGALLVSLADKLHNARAIRADLLAHGDAVWRRFSATSDLVAGYYVALARGFAAQRHRLAYDGPAVDAAVAELEEVARGLCAAAAVDPEAAARPLSSAGAAS